MGPPQYIDNFHKVNFFIILTRFLLAAKDPQDKSRYDVLPPLRLPQRISRFSVILETVLNGVPCDCNEVGLRVVEGRRVRLKIPSGVREKGGSCKNENDIIPNAGSRSLICSSCKSNFFCLSGPFNVLLLATSLF